jgi:tRNA-uridine 2-sulfurtransferase
MLGRLEPRLLERLWFPVGEQTKEETRVEAELAGLRVARRPESQEACFLGGGDYRDFLGRHGLAPAAGAVVDEGGEPLGTHDGFWRFTPGQRRGLGVATGNPVYALRSDPATNTVVVGPRERLARSAVTATGRLYVPVTRAEVKVRHRSPAIPCGVEPLPHGFQLRLDGPAYGVAAGQAAVLYEQDAVVGAGLIAESDS